LSSIESNRSPAASRTQAIFSAAPSIVMLAGSAARLPSAVVMMRGANPTMSASRPANSSIRRAPAPMNSGG
jgi:hypothetical protein